MTDANTPAIACTLSPDQLPLREQAFAGLFASALRRIELLSPIRATLEFDPGCADAARVLFTLEHRCCAFFEFGFTTDTGTFRVDIAVLDGGETALAELLALATPGTAG